MAEKESMKFSEPIGIRGDSVIDERGKVSFVNDFSFDDVKRFYIIQNHTEFFVRAWQCHKYEAKYFMVIDGTAMICAVQLDDWDNPSKNLSVQQFILSEEKPEVLKIPAGYANGIMNITKKAKVMIFATTTLEETNNDDKRLNPYYWNPWKIYGKK